MKVSETDAKYIAAHRAVMRLLTVGADNPKHGFSEALDALAEIHGTYLTYGTALGVMALTTLMRILNNEADAEKYLMLLSQLAANMPNMPPDQQPTSDAVN